MHKFRDTEGREWQIGITIGDLKRVRGELDIDLGNLHAGDPPLLTRLEQDVCLLIDCVFVLIQPQAAERGVSDLAFATAMGGDAASAAHDAFWRALSDFFLELKRTDVVAAIAKVQKLMTEAIEKSTKQLEQINLETLSRSTSGESSTNGQGSSESIPVRSARAS